MTRTKWYRTLLILVAVLYLFSYGSNVASSYYAQSSHDYGLGIFSIWDGLIIAWLIWRIMKERMNVEGLIAPILLFISQLLVFFLPPFSSTNPFNLSFILTFTCIICVFLLIKNVEFKSLLDLWKSEDGWKSSIAYIGTLYSCINLSGRFWTVSIDTSSSMFSVLMYFTVIDLIYLLLLNIMITSKNEVYLKISSILLILNRLAQVVLYYSIASSISFSSTWLFSLLLSVYLACRVFGVFTKLAERLEPKVQSAVEGVSLESSLEGEKPILQDDEGDDKQLEGSINDSKRGVVFNSSWLWSALIIAIGHLVLALLPILVGNPMWLLVLFVGSIHYICFIIATILLLIGMKKGSKSLVNLVCILFFVSMIGTLDSYWIMPNILSITLGVLVAIGSRYPQNYN